MLKPTNEHIKKAQARIGKERPQAAGYRIIVKPIPSDSGLKAGEAEKYETLAKTGFVTQSSTQTERETRGAIFGILTHIGEQAFKGDALGGKPWAEVGEIVIFNRYAGQRVDIPPGSGDFYHFCNDEDILGKYEGKIDE